MAIDPDWRNQRLAAAPPYDVPASARNPFRGTGPWLYWADPQSRFNANPDVIDPLGNLMLRYPRDPDPRRMIKDLTRLLKVSRVG